MSAATVDRVLHQRPGTHHQTVVRVNHALRELEEQTAAHVPLGRGMHVDVVMHAPQRFTSQARLAALTAAASLKPLRVAPRFHFDEKTDATSMAARLKRLARNGTDGVIVKAGCEMPIVNAVNDLVANGVPVVTLATDISESARHAYIGINNHAAGRTAAYLLGRFVAPMTGTVLANLGSHGFQGEGAREAGFREILAKDFPQLTLAEITGSYGLDRETRRLVGLALNADKPVVGIYSMGGGNRGILQAFADIQQRRPVIVGHDLDETNQALLETSSIDAVVDHDLTADLRTALAFIIRLRQGHRLETPPTSRAIVVTPWNIW